MTPRRSSPSSKRRLRTAERSLWRRPSLAQGAMLLLGVLVGAGMWHQSVWLLDTFTLALHEAGHPVVGIFSAPLMVYGGTLFQLLFPWLTKRHFDKKKHVFGSIFALYWMAASLHNVGMYMADARAKALPLVGGLDPEDAHDWAEIFWRWGLLKYDTALGGMTMFAGWAVLGWALWRCYSIVDSNKAHLDHGVSETSIPTKEQALVDESRNNTRHER